MATSAAAAEADESVPPLLRLLSHQDLSLFLPFMLGLSDDNHHHHPPRPPPPPPPQSDRIVLINPVTQGTVVLDTPTAETLDPFLLRRLPPPPLSPYPPASPSSIEALPVVEIEAESGGKGSSDSAPCCVICLEEWRAEEKAGAREMPCRHRFHGGCIERWLRVHGSCPICRFRMPADQVDHTPDPYHRDGYHGPRDSEVWVSFSFSRVSRSSGDNPISLGDRALD